MTITPQQAQALLEGATPGPWEWADCDDEGGGTHMALRNPAGEKALHTVDAESYASWVEGTPEDLRLAATAPTMAEQIAGMQWEYGVEQYTLDNPHWHTAIPYDRGFDQDKCTQLAETFRANNPHNQYRIVRRLVGEPEVID